MANTPAEMEPDKSTKEDGHAAREDEDGMARAMTLLPSMGRKTRAGSATKPPPKPASYRLPAELREMVYEAVLTESVVEVDRTGRDFVENEEWREFARNKRNCRLVFGRREDHVMAALVMYRVADPAMLGLWLAQRPQFKTVVRRLEIHSNHHWNCDHGRCGYSGVANSVSRHAPAWFRWPDMALKARLPRLQEVRLEVRFEMGYFVGLCTLTIQRVVCAETRRALDEWEEAVAAWNPGLRVAAQSLALQRAVSRFQ